ncbi:DUF3349 domain-containing protein [Streptomyces sp. NPDC056600]|uniref:DUF3349 domain-containing protein n=1 Tax=Streptomyces sp. NPDC056600 TaxID=3345874 RepID=UPI003681D0A8
MEEPQPLEPHLAAVVALLRKAFPTGVDAQDRLPLLAVPAEGLCEENAGRVAAAFLRADRHAVENGAARPPNRARRDRAAVLRLRLERYGWDPEEG